MFGVLPRQSGTRLKAYFIIIYMYTKKRANIGIEKNFSATPGDISSDETELQNIYNAYKHNAYKHRHEATKNTCSR